MRHHKNWLEAYLAYTEGSEAPTDFHYWVGVATIAGALQRRVWIDQRLFQWVPNFYIVLVGPAGVVTKSTTLNVGMDLLAEVPGISWGPTSMTWQALTQAMEEASVCFNWRGEEYPMSPITIPLAELGTFLRTDDNELVDVLVSLWDGQVGVWHRKTKTAGESKIVNPWINIVGCTTPVWLQQNFTKSMVHGGLFSRMIFVWGDEKRQLVPYPAEVKESKEHKELRRTLVEDLVQIGQMKGEFDMTRGAIAWGKAWYERHWEREAKGLASEGYAARKQTHLHKLAMVLAAARRQELVIGEEDMRDAEASLLKVEPHLAKVLQIIQEPEVSAAMRKIVSYIESRQGGRAKLSEVWNRFMLQLSPAQLKEAVDSAVSAGLLFVSKLGPDTYLVRRSSP